MKLIADRQTRWTDRRTDGWTKANERAYNSKKYCELKIKEALLIKMTPDNKFNGNISLELPGCWLSMLHANNPPEFNKQ